MKQMVDSTRKWDSLDFWCARTALRSNNKGLKCLMTYKISRNHSEFWKTDTWRVYTMARPSMLGSSLIQKEINAGQWNSKRIVPEICYYFYTFLLIINNRLNLVLSAVKLTVPRISVDLLMAMKWSINWENNKISSIKVYQNSFCCVQTIEA